MASRAAANFQARAIDYLAHYGQRLFRSDDWLCKQRLSQPLRASTSPGQSCMKSSIHPTQKAFGVSLLNGQLLAMGPWLNLQAVSLRAFSQSRVYRYRIETNDTLVLSHRNIILIGRQLTRGPLIWFSKSCAVSTRVKDHRPKHLHPHPGHIQVPKKQLA